MAEFQLAVAMHRENPVANRAAAIEHLRRSLELDPENARAHLFMGSLFLFDRDWEHAEESLRRGIAMLEESNDQLALVAEARNLLGLVYLHQDRVDDAIPLLRQSALELTNRGRAFAWGNLGWAYMKKRQWQPALEALGEAVRVNPQYCEGHYRIGAVHAELEQLDVAEADLTRAVEVHPDCARFQDAWRLRGEVRARLGHREDAISDFERCVELSASSDAGLACRRFLETTH
jgi:type IV pilus assembly protein PilF